MSYINLNFILLITIQITLVINLPIILINLLVLYYVILCGFDIEESDYIYIYKVISSLNNMSY